MFIQTSKWTWMCIFVDAEGIVLLNNHALQLLSVEESDSEVVRKDNLQF
jgi:hypothetical protein